MMLKDNSELTKAQSLGLRGLCISLIVLHNFIHNVIPFAENESSFNIDNAQYFLDNILSHPIMGSLSYLGWLGVPMFFFLSGYGLHTKYAGNIDNKFSFIKKHYLKLLFLAGPFILISGCSKIIHLHSLRMFVDAVLSLSFLNQFWGATIYPRAFWYIRVAFEFYILYAFIHKINPKYLVAVGGVYR
ncbi:MAG: hypothetical protein IJ681_03165 [Bacteroidales bacterium]|nr:hypothetical protein [Bacteroidales bacterium]